MSYEKMIFELSREGRHAYSLPELDVPSIASEELIPSEYLREDEVELPEVSELDLVRDYTL